MDCNLVGRVRKPTFDLETAPNARGADRGAPASCGRRCSGSEPSEYLNQLCSIPLHSPPAGLRHLAAQVGASQIMVGSDLPFEWEPHPVDHVPATTSLSDEEKVAILGGNAARPLGLDL